jgi:hypothetical protein
MMRPNTIKADSKIGNEARQRSTSLVVELSDCDSCCSSVTLTISTVQPEMPCECANDGFKANY